MHIALRKMCPYSELFWCLFSRIRNEYGEIRIISLYSDQMREDTGQNNSEYGNFLGSVEYVNISLDVGTATNVYKLLLGNLEQFSNVVIEVGDVVV